MLPTEQHAWMGKRYYYSIVRSTFCSRQKEKKVLAFLIRACICVRLCVGIASWRRRVLNNVRRMLSSSIPIHGWWFVIEGVDRHFWREGGRAEQGCTTSLFEMRTRGSDGVSLVHILPFFFFFPFLLFSFCLFQMVSRCQAFIAYYSGQGVRQLIEESFDYYSSELTATTIW